MQLDHPGRRLLIFGKSGFGKTVLLRRFILGASYAATFIFDHDGQYAYKNKITPAFSPADIDAQMASRRFVVFMPLRMFPGRKIAAFAFFSEYAYRWAQDFPGEKLFAVDEIQKFVPNNSLPVEFSELYEEGRHYGFDFAVSTQAPNRVHNGLRGQATEIITFQVTDETPLKALKQLDFDIERVKNLPRGSFIMRDNDHSIFYDGRVF